MSVQSSFMAEVFVTWAIFTQSCRYRYKTDINICWNKSLIYIIKFFSMHIFLPLIKDESWFTSWDGCIWLLSHEELNPGWLRYGRSRASSVFSRSDQCLDFIIVNTKYVVLPKYIVQSSRCLGLFQKLFKILSLS